MRTLRSSTALLVTCTYAVQLLTFYPQPAMAQSTSVPAFPGAEGSGAVSVGGRGGRVIEVTNLNDSGAGSLRAAVQATGPRIVVFRVAGTIWLKSQLAIANPYITIAGQTAPGPITISGRDVNGDAFGSQTNNVIVQYVRIRVGKGSQGDQSGDGVGFTGGSSNIIFDHVSISWGIDGAFDIWGTASQQPRNITLSNSLVAETLVPHPTGLLVGCFTNACAAGMGDIDAHHNLLMNSSHRLPLVFTKPYRFVNNIVYNWYNYASQAVGGVAADFIGNHYKRGPISNNVRPIQVSNQNNGNNVSGTPSIYAVGNKGPQQSNPDGDNTPLLIQVSGENGSEVGAMPSGWRRTSPLPTLRFPITAQHANSLESSLLSTVGASRRLDATGNWVPTRDAVDARLISEYNAGTGTIPNNESEVGGFPTTTTASAYADTDRDGMSDTWESMHGLNPNNASDGNQDADGDGFTNIEEFLNGTSPRGGASPAPTPTPTPTPAPTPTPTPDPEDNASPVVALTWPTANATLSRTVTFTATATDRGSGVVGVQFLVNGTAFGSEDTSAPYSLSVNSTQYANRSYTVQVRARDAAGNLATSPAVTVRVAN